MIETIHRIPTRLQNILDQNIHLNKTFIQNENIVDHFYEKNEIEIYKLKISLYCIFWENDDD